MYDIFHGFLQISYTKNSSIKTYNVIIKHTIVTSQIPIKIRNKVN